jgi:hypothetical protein
MADYHTKTFFGQKKALILTSPTKTVPYIFLSCISKKEDGSWESLSNQEGKTVKISIEEIICILEVLNKKSANWRGSHVFKERRTEIYVGWESEAREVIGIKIGEYVKKLRFPNLNLFILMLEHVLSEKVEFATSGTFDTKETEKTEDENEYGVFSERITARDGLQIVETTEYGLSAGTIQVSARIKVESPKALLITLDSGEEFWIPKSTIHNNYDISLKKKLQKLLVDKWIIEKNKIIND